MEAAQEKARIALAKAGQISTKIRQRIDEFAFKDQNDVRARAAAVISTGNFARRGGQREQMLEGFIEEWQADLLIAGDTYTKAAAADPDGVFLDWLQERVRQSFWTSGQARKWAKDEADRINRKAGRNSDLQGVFLRIWEAELAWALQQRKSPDVRMATMAAAWYRAAILGPTRHFQEIIKEHLARSVDDSVYLGSPERELTREEIMTAPLEHLPDWVPLWRQVAEKNKDIIKIKDLPEQALLERKALYDEEYQIQIDRERGERVAMKFAQVRPARMPVIIGAAIDIGWDAQALVEAEREFTGRLFEGRVEIVQPTGFGYREFFQWISSKPDFKPTKPVKATESMRREAFVAKPPSIRTWMPGDFDDFGSQNDALYKDWQGRVAAATLRCPETQDERSSAFLAVIGRLKCRSSQQIMGMQVLSEFEDHPLVVHYGWYLVKRERDRVAGAMRDVKAG